MDSVHYAEYLLESMRQAPHKLLEPKTNSPSNRSKSIHQRMLDLYVEECLQKSEDDSLDLSLDLLQTLVKKDRLSTVVVKLYPGNEGYSIMLRGKSGITDTETIKLPYEESEILDYIDNAELPPMFIELLEKAQVNVFYSGCVIVELRDYRRSTTGTYDSQYVLLKPTPESILHDINTITNDGHLWTQEDRNQLESQLLLATQGPLCLDPSPAVSYVNNRLQYGHGKFNTPLLKRNARKYSQAAINRKRKFSQSSAPKELDLYEFLHNKKDRTKPTAHVKAKSYLDPLRQKSMYLPPPSNVDVHKYAKVLDKPRTIPDNSLVLVEEYVLERERNQAKSHQTKSMYTKVSVYLRPSDEYYFGELYIDHDYIEGLHRGKSCQFSFGSKSNVKKYIEQLVEIFTEGGRLYARVSHNDAEKALSNVPPNVPYSQPTSLISPPLPLNAADVTPSAQLSVSVSPSSTPGTVTSLVSPVTPTAGSEQLTPTFNINDGQSHPLLQKPSQSYPSKQRHSSSKNTYQISPGSSSPVIPPTSVLPPYQSPYPSPHKPSTKHTPLPTQSPQPLMGLPAQGSLPLNMPPLTFVTTATQQLRSDSSMCYTLMSPPSITSTVATGNQPPPNINIANISALNIQNLAQLQGIAGIQGLHNIQVSLGNLPLSGSQLTLPVTHSSQSVSANQGVLVNTLPGGVASTLVTSQSANILQPISPGPITTSPQSYATMATTVSNSLASPTSGTSPSQVFTLPVSIATNPLVARAMKSQQAAHNVRGQTLYQLPNQLQMLSAQQKAQMSTKTSPHVSVPISPGSYSGPATNVSLANMYNQPAMDTRLIDNQPPRRLSGGHQNIGQQPNIAQQQNMDQQNIAALQNMRFQNLGQQYITSQTLVGQSPNMGQSNIGQQQGIGQTMVHQNMGQQSPHGINAGQATINLAAMSHNIPSIHTNLSSINPSLNPNLSTINANLSGLSQSSQSQNMVDLQQVNLPGLSPQHLTGLAHNVIGPQQPGLQTQLTVGHKPGTPAYSQHQLMQLASMNPQNLTPQQIHTQMSLQRQLQLRQGNTGIMGLNSQQSVASTSKYKRGKRPTPTSPK